MPDTSNAFVITNTKNLRFHRWRIAVTTLRKGHNKHICWDDFAGIRVDDGRGISGSTHLHDLIGLVIYVHCGICFRQVVAAILVELRGLT